MAHDLRTPLNAIALAARVLEQLLSRGNPDTTQEAPMLKALNRNVQHLETLVQKVVEQNSNLETEVGIR